MSGNDWKRGLERINPGVYADKSGGMHIDEEELLRANGYSVNERNLEMIRRAASEVSEKMGASFHLDSYHCARCGAAVSDPATHSCEGEALG